jgi:hypothetical protein
MSTNFLKFWVVSAAAGASTSVGVGVGVSAGGEREVEISCESIMQGGQLGWDGTGESVVAVLRDSTCIPYRGLKCISYRTFLCSSGSGKASDCVEGRRRRGGG